MASQVEFESLMREAKDALHRPIFEQVLELDEDPIEKEFSRTVVHDFFSQAETTFTKMKKAHRDCDMTELVNLSHFLKGSSATLGLSLVRKSCERIQRFGSLTDENGQIITTEHAYEKIGNEIRTARRRFREVEVLLRRFYKDNEPTHIEIEDEDDSDPESAKLGRASAYPFLSLKENGDPHGNDSNTKNEPGSGSDSTLNGDSHQLGGG